MTKCIVFGADGFIGRNLVTGLSESGDYDIVAFDKFSAFQNGEQHPFDNLNGVSRVSGNFLNREDVAKVLEEDAYVFHLVSTTTPAASSNDPLIDLDTNIRASVELFQLCSRKKINKIIFPSSGGTIYGNVDAEKIKETIAPKPQSPYGIGKLTIENYLRYFRETTGLKYIVYRIANPYGPGQNIYGKQGIVPIFMYKYLNNEEVTIFGDGTMVRDYIYIQDLVKMILQSFYKDNKFDEYNLGSGVGHSVNDILSAIEICTGKKVGKKYIDAPVTFVNRSVLSIERYVNEFGNIEFRELSSGVEDTWKYVQSLK